MAKTIGFGILGAGLIAPFHAKAVRDTNGGKLIANFVQTLHIYPDTMGFHVTQNLRQGHFHLGE